jgi:choline dehydrogenase-like flavoprotein
LRSLTGSAATRSWDYIVVGAGAAGCVVAGRLSQTMPDARIALIEAGGTRLRITTKIPGTAFIASTSPQRNWNFETEPIPALNGRKLWWFQGRILGGSGSINGMLYLRGHSLEYEQWAQLGCHGWSFEQVLPYFKKAETNTRGANEWHGNSGPITVKPSRIDLPICEAFSPPLERRGSRWWTTLMPMSRRASAGSTPTSPTAAARALRWLMYNRPGGAEISNWCRRRSQRAS